MSDPRFPGQEGPLDGFMSNGGIVDINRRRIWSLCDLWCPLKPSFRHLSSIDHTGVSSGMS